MRRPWDVESEDKCFRCKTEMGIKNLKVVFFLLSLPLVFFLIPFSLTFLLFHSLFFFFPNFLSLLLFISPHFSYRVNKQSRCWFEHVVYRICRLQGNNRLHYSDTWYRYFYKILNLITDHLLFAKHLSLKHVKVRDIGCEKFDILWLFEFYDIVSSTARANIT